MTNFDKLKQLAAKDFAEILTNNCCLYCAYRGKCPCGVDCSDGIEEWLEHCKRGIRLWLEQEAEQQ